MLMADIFKLLLLLLLLLFKKSVLCVLEAVQVISNLKAGAVSPSDTLLSTCPNTCRLSPEYRNTETSFPYYIAVRTCDFRF